MATILRMAVSLAPRLYHRLLSPFLPPACRFFPPCSVYTSVAIEKYGILKGLSLGFRRLFRCHPWNLGGYDPVR